MAGDPVWVVLATGAVTIAGSLAVTWVQHGFQKSSALREQKLMRLQELFTALGELNDWMQDYTFADNPARMLMKGSPLNKIIGLVSVNFPDLYDHTLKLELAETKLRLWLFQNPPNSAGYTVQGYQQAQTPYVQTLRALRAGALAISNEQHRLDGMSFTARRRESLSKNKQSSPTEG